MNLKERDRAMDQIENSIGLEAVKACTEHFGDHKFALTGKKDDRGRYLIDWTYAGQLKGLDHVTVAIAIQYFIEGFRVSADRWEW